MFFFKRRANTNGWTVFAIVLIILFFIWLKSGEYSSSPSSQKDAGYNTVSPFSPPSAYCGDSACNVNENCSVCSSDCGECKNDNSQKMKESIVRVTYAVSGKNPGGSYYAEKSFSSGSGVIYSNTDSKLLIFTSRHVVDCGFDDSCYQRLSEKITIRTQDGKIHPVSAVYFAPHELDIASLEVNTPNSEDYVAVTVNENPAVGDRVIAIGYPLYTEDVVEFSAEEGIITKLKDLLMSDGFAFESIESGAYTYFGSSGGGLFDEEGALVGINTWGNNQNSIAIKMSSLRNIDSFVYCKSGSYLTGEHCMNYCAREEVLGMDDRCYGRCEEFYCESRTIIGNDERCEDTSLIVGSDGYCHKPCGSFSTYCGDPNAICFKERCITCALGEYLFKDGTCRLFQ